MPFYQFPGSDFHDLNLDWLLEQMKNCLAEWATTKTQWEALDADNAAFKTRIEAEWDELEQFVTNYFTNLDVSEEISDKINAMVADGSLLALVQTTVETAAAGSASSWLAQYITQETGYVLDNSLTITNAAADSRAAGVVIAQKTDENIISAILPEADKTVTHDNITCVKSGIKYTLNGSGNAAVFRFRFTDTLEWLADTQSMAKFGTGIQTVSGHLYRFRIVKLAGTATKEPIPSLFKPGPSSGNMQTVTPNWSGKGWRWWISDGSNILLAMSLYPDSEFTNAVYTVEVEDATSNIMTSQVDMTDLTGELCSADTDGKIGAPNTARAFTVKPIPVDCVKFVQAPVDQQICLCLFDKDQNFIGWCTNSGITAQVSWMSSPGFLVPEDINAETEIAYVRIYAKKTTYSAKSDMNTIVIYGSVPDKYPKVWYAIGDSITYGTFSKNDGTIERNPLIAFSQVASNNLGWDLYNWGVPNLGFTVDATDSQFTTRSSVTKLLNLCTFNYADIVTVSLGTNDYGRNGTLGTLSDSTSANSVYGRAKLIVETIKTKAPGARILFVTPIPRETNGSANSRYCMTYPNGSGFTLEDVADAIREICTYYGIECVDFSESCPLNYFNFATYQKDELHPTVAGHKLLGEVFASKIEF